ncbi:hypothetical protein L3X37_13715 [Sabulilitoribacter arenilitoris]|uniref:Uncharacterized protein n=1 Tax=Wocania arenilitoris TaxID=2044858 RepID=A0AAE3JMK0_9FLAO|nr:hypothetical protein [Wocania arenilitoris]MCF7569407.1 hypothetical protein [Wocania arenilitoris]
MKTIVLTSILILEYFNIKAQENDLVFLHQNDIDTTHTIKRITLNHRNTYLKT